MLDPNFKNGKKLDVQSAFAFFVIIMGLLFHIEAAEGLHSMISFSTVVFGVVWFVGRQFYCHQHHPHS